MGRLAGVLLWLLSVWVSTAFAGERVALVIGNSAYKSAPLTNPRNDAEAMATLLGKAGFEVDRQLDTGLSDLQSAVERFGKTIRDPKVKFGLFYYAGHGLQQDWRNYLVPTTANIRTAADVPKQTVDISQLLRYMEQSQGRSFLVILDACRDDPFAGSFRPAAAGLSQFDAPVGSLLAYATSPGNVAEDGEGQNGLYTGHLLREFAVAGARIEDAFKRVRLNVRIASKGRQIPWESTSLEEDVYLFPLRSKALTDTERDQLLEKEINHWLRVKNSDDPEVLATFIREYPSGYASELAQSRMNRMLAAMAEREDRRLQSAAESIKAEQLRLALAQQAKEQAERERAVIATAALFEAARIAAEQARAAEEAARQIALAKIEAARIAAELAEAQRQAIAAARAEMARKAAAELAAQREREEQQRLAKAQQLQEEQARQQAAVTAAQLQEAERLKALRLEQEAQQLAREKAQAEQKRLALAALAEEQAIREQAVKEAAMMVEAARLAAEQSRAAEDAARLATSARLESARLAAAKAESDRLMFERTKAEQLAQRLAQLEASQTKALAAQVSLVPTPFFKGYSEFQRHFTVGDEYTIRVVDQLTKAAKPLVMKVTQVDLNAERVTYNDGEFASDLMGNTTTNQRGLFSTPRQFYPAELIVGKKWQTRFKQSRPNGVSYTYQYDLKVVGRESVTVPAGTFDCYKIEARGFNMELSAYLERNIWVSPGISADIAHEIKVRLRNGRMEQNDRQELMTYTQQNRSAVNTASN